MPARKPRIARKIGKPTPVERAAMPRFAAETRRIQRAARTMKSKLARGLARKETTVRKRVLNQWKEDIKKG